MMYCNNKGTVNIYDYYILLEARVIHCNINIEEY